MTVDRAPITEWLRQLLVRGTSKTVYVAEIPADATYPYVTLHSIAGGETWGAHLAEPDDSADLVYQVDSVGLRQDQAEALGDRVRRTVLARSAGRFQVDAPVPAPYAVIGRDLHGGVGGATREGSDPHDVVSYSERYLIRVTGA